MIFFKKVISYWICNMILIRKKGTVMRSILYAVKNPLGIHARPAALLAQACTDLKSSVTLECNGNVASGKNVLQILALHAAKGSTLKISVEGPDGSARCCKVWEVCVRDLKNPSNTSYD